MNSRRAQVTLEFSVTMVLVVILFFVTAYFFFWVTHSLVSRQNDYESSPEYGRATAGAWNNHANAIQVDESGAKKLNFFDMNLPK